MDSNFIISHLDAGSPPTHQTFNSKIVQSITFDKVGNIRNDHPFSNEQNHGSLTSRVIFNDELYPLPPLSSTVKYATVSVPSRGKNLLNLLKGMDHLIGMNPKIVCMPFGFRKRIPIFYPMICSFLKKGILPIIPIGNKGGGRYHTPGCYPGVISVGALAANGKVARSSGSLLDDVGNCLKPDILAPGSFLLTPKQPRKNGTSFACAYIVGLAARLLQAQPDATTEDIKQVLFSTTITLPSEQSHRCKRGIVQPDAALEFLLQDKNSTPIPQQESIPFFLKEPYRDKRFLSQLKNAKPDSLLEAIIIPNPNIGKLMDAQDSSTLSHHLILNIQKASGLAPDYCHYFIHADMAHIRARVSFFEVLLKHPSLFTISAVDVNIFEM